MNKNDIQVAVETQYLPLQSSPGKKQYAFAYHITLSNEGDLGAQLISRHWIISDGNGESREVKGMGVVGEQPLIAPGESYKYSSGAVLDTEVGTMQGSYHMQGENGLGFELDIPVFTLAVPNALN
ncbi:MAG: Co2+/Mg2+ efflux protein ApaG [Gammaproteobacteria bacterium]|nr:Co2+/Mg2+ efflux protein ApaG [Gammaproteobacteria bacterium]MBQ0839462.1 Co2+/Mg2+ efflux protein ApaG [Gammaproteobacteria bacterium]